jgi:hypothetical protein
MPEKALEPIPSQTRAVMERIVMKEIGGTMKSLPLVFAHHGDTAVLLLVDQELGRATFENGLWRSKGHPGCAKIADLVHYWLRSNVDRIATALVKE